MVDAAILLAAAPQAVTLLSQGACQFSFPPNRMMVKADKRFHQLDFRGIGRSKPVRNWGLPKFMK
jgi:hypothetical protein